MGFLYRSCLVSVLVLLAFSGNCDARVVSELSEMAEIEKIVTSKNYQELQDSIIMKGFDKHSQTAKAAIEAIRNEGTKLEASGLSQGGIDLVLDSILTAVRIVSRAEKLADEALDKAVNMAAKDPNAAIESLKKNMKVICDLVVTFGVPIEDLFGSALALAGGSNQDELQRGMSYMQSAGTAVLEAFKIAEQLATMGIEAGGRAAQLGLKAAREAVATGGSTCFKYHHKGAKHIIDESLKRASSVSVLNKADRVAGILKSLTTPVTTVDPAALNAIDSINAILKSILSDDLTTQTAKDSAKIITQSLISTIMETADAVSIAKEALKESEKIATQDIDLAVDIVQKGIEAAKNEVIHGSSIGFLGFGAARQITDGAITIDGLISSMVELIFGRILAVDNLKLAQDIALMGIRSGAVEQGINGAMQICEEAENVLFAQFLESASIGLDHFRRM